MRNFINPYFCYAISFSIPLLIYHFQWSDLYPKLSGLLLLFLIVTLTAHILAGFVVSQRKPIFFNRIVTDNISPIIITAAIYFLWMIEFLYEGGIPVLKIILKQPYNYVTFGVPSLHVFLVTFSSFYTIFLFHLYLSQKKKLLLVLYVTNLLAALLIYNRGMLFFNLSSSILLYAVYSGAFSIKKLGIACVFLTALLFLFGMLGTLRVSRLAGKPYSNKEFLMTGGANENFFKSNIPSEFFWPYIYITSPLANLQTNISTRNVKPVTAQSIALLINNEVLMDFISKRTNKYFDIPPEGENTIQGPFNVSTVYSRAFSYTGWPGMMIMAIIILIIPWVYLKILPMLSPFFLTGFVILSTLFLFLAFDNMLRFTGLSFQLVYPVIFHYAAEKIPLLKKLFVNNKVTTR